MQASSHFRDPAALIPSDEVLSTHCMEGWLGSRASLDVEENLLLLPGIEHRSSNKLPSHCIELCRLLSIPSFLVIFYSHSRQMAAQLDTTASFQTISIILPFDTVCSMIMKATQSGHKNSFS
jgi:hypothetical protein